MDALVPTAAVTVDAALLVEGRMGHCARKIATSAEHTEWFCFATIALHSLS